jgi:nitric oxide synthase oxygenase domain/subunit
MDPEAALESKAVHYARCLENFLWKKRIVLPVIVPTTAILMDYQILKLAFHNRDRALRLVESILCMFQRENVPVADHVEQGLYHVLFERYRRLHALLQSDVFLRPPASPEDMAACIDECLSVLASLPGNNVSHDD